MPNFKVKGVQFEGIRFAISNCSFQSCNPKYLVSTPLIFKFCYAQKPFLLEVLQIWLWIQQFIYICKGDANQISRLEIIMVMQNKL